MNEISGELLTKASRGDMEAFSAIYKGLCGFVYNVALGITQNRPDAEEVTQDVFVKIYRNLNGFGFRSSFKTWVYRITVNTAINKYKISARNNKRFVNGDEALQSASDEGKGMEFIDREDKRGKLESILSALSPDLRSCIVLREMEGLSYKEIAQSLAIPINTVRSRLKRPREALLARVAKGGVNR